MVHTWARTALLSGWWHECALCLVRSCIFLLEGNHPFLFQRKNVFFFFLLIALQILCMKGHHFLFFVRTRKRTISNKWKYVTSGFTSPFSTFSPSNNHRRNKIGHHRGSKKKPSIQQRLKNKLLIWTRTLKILESSKINVFLLYTNNSCWEAQYRRKSSAARDGFLARENTFRCVT